MPRASNTEHRRAEIVAAMLKVVAANGYEKATIQEIAKSAGLTPGLIHYHFKDKQEMLVALARSLSDYVYRRYSQLAERARTPEERLRAYLEARLGFGKGSSTDAVAAWVVIGSEAIRQPTVAQVYEDAIAFEMKLVNELLAQYLTQRKKSRARVGELTAILMSFIEGAFQLSRTAQRVMPRRYAARAAFMIVDQFAQAAGAGG